MRSDSIYNLLFSINRGYIPHFKTALNSLLKNNEDKSFRLFLMSSDLKESDFSEILSSFRGRNVSIEKLDVDEKIFEGFPTVKRYPFTIYYRLIAPLLLPEEVEKILYLDSDLIVHGDISRLYDISFEDRYYFIGCTQIGKLLTGINVIRLDAKDNAVYLNTGVMMMNVKELRHAVNVAEIREYVTKRKAFLVLYDQDIVCRFFGDKVKLVDPYVFNLPDRRVTASVILQNDDVDPDWVEKNNLIIHYLGKNKPWKDNYRGHLKNYYLMYKMQ